MTDYIKLSEFYNSDFVNYSSYDNLRKISQIDGLKNASKIKASGLSLEEYLGKVN